MLGRNPRRAGAEEEFALAAIDSGSDTKWMTFASRAQVDTLVTALERTAIAGRAVFSAAEPEPDTPVTVVSIPRPAYPGALATIGGVGRVWMQFVVGPDGRAREESFRSLLADDPRFTSAAVRALRRGRFKPATRNGQPVAQRVFQVIEFRSRN
jgi:protein TonB